MNDLSPGGLDPVEALGEWIDADPDTALVELDRHLVAEGGLRMFAELAWPTVQGNAASFVGGWHIDAICEHLEAVSRGEIRRLIIMIPPRHMKSLSVAVSYPAWDWLRNPWRQFLYASYAHALSIRDSRRTRRIIQSPWYQRRWGDRFRITSDQNTKVRFDNDHTGYRLATSVDGMLTGEGADVIISDDPHNVRQAESDKIRETVITWWSESMSTRLNDPKRGAYVIIMQRVHERDLVGYLLAQASVVPWTVLCLPAEYEPEHPQRWIRDPRKEPGELLWPQRFGRPEMEDLKQRLGSYAAAAQLQQRPAPREGGIFKRKWFGTIRVAPADVLWVRGWDFAASEKTLIKADPDYTATVKVGWSSSLQRWIIGHAERRREEAHEIEKWLKQQAEADGLAVVIQLPQDPGQAGKPVYEEEIILLGDGQRKPLKEVVVGDLVINKNGEPTAVLEVHEQGYLPCRRIETESGRSLITALDHPFLTPDGWIEMQNLTTDSVLALLSRPNTSHSSGRSLEEFRLAGYFIGDGSIGKKADQTSENASCNAGFCCADPIQLADFIHCVTSLGGAVTNRGKRGIDFGTTGLQWWLRDTGLSGATSYTKRVPSWVFQGSQEQTANFIGAFFACDGWIGEAKREVIFYSVSRGLLEDVQHLLLRLGINSTLRTKNGRYLDQRHRSWLLRLRQKDDAYGRFLGRVRVIHSRKAATLGRILADARYRRFDEAYLPDCIVDIEDTESLPCRCLTVARGASFTVQDIVVHNSQTQNFIALLSRYTTFATPVTGDKMARALAWAGKAGAGMVLLLEGEWVEPFMTELTSFPTGAHDDYVDAVSSAFDRLANNTLGIMSWFEQQLVGAGRSLADIKTPYDRQQEEAAAAVAAGTAPAPAPAVSDRHIEDLARALGYKPPSEG